MANIKDLIQSIESSDSSFDEKLAAINEMEETLVAMRSQEQEAIDDNVAMIVEAIAVMQRKVEAQLEVAKAIVPEIGPMGPKGAPGERGLDGANGRDGRDGADGRNGVDGQDGVSVTDAKIDFDGSLVITLSTGREINVGEVVAPDLAEKIKLVTSGGSTSQQVLDAIAAIEATLATYGTMALQNANAVAITGGTINGTTIGSTTPNAATFTTLTSNGLTTLTNGSGSLIIDDGGGSIANFRLIGPTGALGRTRLYSPNQLRISTATTNSINFYTGASSTPSGDGVLQLQVSNTTSAVNYVQVTGAATGGRPTFSAQGSDSNIGFLFDAKGTTSNTVFRASGGSQIQFVVSNIGAGTNYLQTASSATGVAPSFSCQGSDPNIDLALTPKGTGNVRFGTYTGTILTPTGYVEIKDAGGTIRRLLVG